ncbi:hypothetical protein GWI33_018033 [Rhynchophorus ferrugineus]|uniref:Uncharacterized protein n=1 Tax=Rhynchophorus ferrugineus TaxID=354439 RepID=A0A834M5P9_RHYFE|nr:hypothetical protein GWI33_018033 [Rhynchophorus ferrugineus]
MTVCSGPYAGVAGGTSPASYPSRQIPKLNSEILADKRAAIYISISPLSQRSGGGGLSRRGWGGERLPVWENGGGAAAEGDELAAG